MRTNPHGWKTTAAPTTAHWRISLCLTRWARLCRATGKGIGSGRLKVYAVKRINDEKLMAPKKSLLEQMRANPMKGWSMADIGTVCNQVGLTLKPPSSGSHHKVLSDILHGALTVPYKRPVKAFYIKQIVGFADAHIREREARKKKG